MGEIKCLRSLYTCHSASLLTIQMPSSFITPDVAAEGSISWSIHLNNSQSWLSAALSERCCPQASSIASAVQAFFAIVQSLLIDPRCFSCPTQNVLVTDRDCLVAGGDNLSPPPSPDFVDNVKCSKNPVCCCSKNVEVSPGFFRRRGLSLTYFCFLSLPFFSCWFSRSSLVSVLKNWLRTSVVVIATIPLPSPSSCEYSLPSPPLPSPSKYTLATGVLWWDMVSTVSCSFPGEWFSFWPSCWKPCISSSDGTSLASNRPDCLPSPPHHLTYLLGSLLCSSLVPWPGFQMLLQFK